MSLHIPRIPPFPRVPSSDPTPHPSPALPSPSHPPPQSRLNRQQKEAVQQFVAITGTSNLGALAALSPSEWKMELAFDLYSSSSTSTSDRGALAALRASEWNMELAFDLFYSSSTSGLLIPFSLISLPPSLPLHHPLLSNRGALAALRASEWNMELAFDLFYSSSTFHSLPPSLPPALPPLPPRPLSDRGALAALRASDDRGALAALRASEWNMELAFDLFYSSQARPIIPSPSSPSDRGALAALRASEWNMELAFDLFYSSSTSGQQLRALGRSAAPKVDPRQLEHLFLRYKDPHCDLILVDGVSKLCEDLEVDPQDIVMLILSWHFKAATMCEYSKEEFMQGMQRLGVSSAGELKARLPALRSEINDDHKFREIYNFSFDWAKEKVGSQVSSIRHGNRHVAAAVRCVCQKSFPLHSQSSLHMIVLQGHKSLAFDTAIGMWQLLSAASTHAPPHPHLPPLYAHLLFHVMPCRITDPSLSSYDEEGAWPYLITDPSLSSYDEEGAWPYLVDEFVSHLREEGVVPSKPAVGFAYSAPILRPTRVSPTPPQITDPSLLSYDEEGAWPYLVDEFVSHLREEGVVPSKPDAA
ncbi:unnamed protein product [Closterium sp. NIES-64]|nr:unnamed protein product [Closterium sp. NIES-64]